MRSVACLSLVAGWLAACAEPPRMAAPPPLMPSRPAPALDQPPAPMPAAVDCSPPWGPPPERTWRDPNLKAQPQLPPPESRPTPPLEQWDSGNRTWLEAMRAVCDVVYADETVGGRVLLGCASCAIGPTGAPPRVLPADGAGWSDQRRFFQDFAPGSFTRPGADEALVTLAGCEPAADISFMTKQPGYGNALVEKRGEGYRLVGYVGRLGACKETRRRADRKAYVCVNWDRRAERSISVLDWNAKPPRTEILRLAAPRTTDEICDQPDHAEVGELVLDDFDGDDQDGDGIGDLRVRAKLIAWPSEVVRAARAAPDLAAACACEKATRDWVNRVKPGCRCQPVLELGAKTTQAIELSFIARRGKLVPTPATRETLALLRRYQIVEAPSTRR